MGNKFKPVKTKPIQCYFKRTREDDDKKQEQRRLKQLKLDNEKSPIDSPAYDEPQLKLDNDTLPIDSPAYDDPASQPNTTTSNKPERAFLDAIHSDQYGICPTELRDEFESYLKAFQKGITNEDEPDGTKQCDVKKCTLKQMNNQRFCNFHHRTAESFQRRTYAVKCSNNNCKNKSSRSSADDLCNTCQILGENRTRQEHLVRINASHDEIKSQARSDFDKKV